MRPAIDQVAETKHINEERRRMSRASVCRRDPGMDRVSVRCVKVAMATYANKFALVYARIRAAAA